MQEHDPDGDADADRLGLGRGDHLLHHQRHDADHELEPGHSIALSAEGTYTIKYFTVDNVGNQEAVKTAATVICIDKTAPAPTKSSLRTATEPQVPPTTATRWLSRTRSTRRHHLLLELDEHRKPDPYGRFDRHPDHGHWFERHLTITAVGAANCGGTGNFHLGSITLGGNYVGATRTFSGATDRQPTWNPTSHTLTVRLGTPSGIANTGIAVGTPTYTPSSSLEDIAGNTITTSPFSPPAASRF